MTLANTTAGESNAALDVPGVIIGVVPRALDVGLLLGRSKMMLPIYVAKRATPEEFVAFWERYYSYRLEHLYAENIGRPFTSERVHALYEWKNGSRLAAPKRRSVERNYVSRIADLRRLAPNTSAEEFLRQFPSGGAIWRIFWLHCWQPERFPMYDQHVHRAMVYIEEPRVEESPEDSCNRYYESSELH